LLDKVQSYQASPTMRERSEEWVFFALLALVTIIVMLELLSLYSTPVPDSYLWWGDESWLMLEFRTQMLTGVFRHPYALGSSLASGSGIIFGNMWISALFYGIPAAFLSPIAMDIVLLGRTVTAVFAITLLVVLYEIARRLTSDRLLAMLSVLLLVTSRSFLLTSHSARYDILSALAIIVGVYLLLRYGAIGGRAIRSAIVGFCVAATLLITIHVTIALALAALVTVVYQARSGWLRSFFAFIGGAIVFMAFLVGVSALRGQLMLGQSWSGSFALNMHDIPALRFYSRSVQSANFIQRWSTLKAFGFGFILAIAAIVLIAIIQFARRNIRWKMGWRAVVPLVVVLSWTEFESSAPTSYLIYILPVFSLIVALALKRFSSGDMHIWLIAGLGILLSSMALRDMPGTHGNGYLLMTENYQAVGAALDQIEQQDSGAYVSGVHPLVLTFNPAVHEVLRDTNVRLMTTHFVEFPAGETSSKDPTLYVDSVLRAEGVNYALVYLSGWKHDYMREVGPIMAALGRKATPLWERAGYFTDIGRSYFDSKLGASIAHDAPDTLRLYRLHN
jgi:Dolichyl-phosphate-mannose-protein mannosyltransferase